nr:ribosome small subunit-dependent GTPase A [uncultured Oribacterium sp.]
MVGKIIKGIGGFYYVDTKTGVFECHAKGLFRNKKEKPLVGDMVEVEEVPDTEKEMVGQILRILPRKNELIRPLVSNIDQAALVFAVKDPDPSFPLIDRFLLHLEAREIPCMLFFNKRDLLSGCKEDYREKMQRIYEKAGIPVYFFQSNTKEDREEILRLLKGKTTVFSGPSGVGKSSMINLLLEDRRMETGSLSEKIKRGKNTTRHAEFFSLGEDSYVLDTPGFTSLFPPDISPENLRYFYPEFEEYRQSCRYNTCYHLGEKKQDCGVKQAVEKGEIARERYESYKSLYQEIVEERKNY